VGGLLPVRLPGDGADNGGGDKGRAVQALHVTPASWSATTQHAQLLLEMRRARKRGFFVRLAVFVVLPTLLTLLYTTVLATPRYTSEFEITYQTYKPADSLSAGLKESVAGTSQTNSVDLATILYEYIRSAALLRKLDAKLNLRAYYSRPEIDYLSRLGVTASRERFLDYFLWRVSVSQGLGGFLTVDVQAFDPQFAQTLAMAVVQACDEMVDDMTARARSDETRFAEAEVARQEERVKRARLALTEFQNVHGDQDPQRVASQLGTIVGSLEADLASARAQLANTTPYLTATSPIVLQMKSRITSLEQQLSHEQGRLASAAGGTPYSVLLAQYSALQLEEEFAKTAYQAAQQGLTVARADAARKQNYLIDFAPPNEPDKPALSFPVVYTVTVFLGSLLALGFGSLVAGAFRDHAGL
jgi:capsular polysaccharide transport system permease protein